MEVVDEAPAVDGEDEGLDDDKAEKLLKFFFTLVTQASIGRRRFFSRPWTTDFTVGRCTSCRIKWWLCKVNSKFQKTHHHSVFNDVKILVLTQQQAVTVI